jgi:hypothetical protein
MVDGPERRPAIVVEEFAQRLARIEAALEILIAQRTVKEWYTTDEVGSMVKKAPFTVREWCRLGRVRAEKRRCGRGRAQEWIISHDELMRIQNEGLLPAVGYKHYR